MPLKSFTGRLTIFALPAFCLFIFGSAAVAGTGIGWGLNEQVKPSANNPIPGNMGPKSEYLAEEIYFTKYEAREAIVESTNIVYSLAMHEGHNQSQSTLTIKMV